MKQVSGYTGTEKVGGILSKVDQVAAMLESLLRDGGFKTGDRFPSAYEIARDHGVSAGTARKALKVLVERGDLEVSDRSGHFVLREIERPAVQDRQPAKVVAAVATVLLVITGPLYKGGKRVRDEYLAALAQFSSQYGWDVVSVENQADQINQAIEGKQLAGCLAYGLKEPPAVKIDPSTVISWGAYGEFWHDPSNSILAMDGEAAARLAFEHLWDMGHQRTAMVRPRDRKLASAKLVLGMRRAYAEIRRSWDIADVIYVDPQDLSGLYGRLRTSGVTGIVCDVWEMVVELYRQAHQHGEQIGDRLSIVTVGGHDMSEILQPAPARARWRAIDYAHVVVEALYTRQLGEPMPPQLMISVFLEEGAGVRPPSFL